VNAANARRDRRMSPPLLQQPGITTGLRRDGFSPMLGAPAGEAVMQSGDIELMLGEMETADLGLAGGADG
jgi:hypothetical protein